MDPLTPDQIRASFVNALPGEAERMPMPALHDVLWESREYFGWRDARSHQRGYLVYWHDNAPVGIVLRASEFSLQPGISAMCSLCRITQPSGQVTLFSAPRPGQAGIDGNTIGTYICDDLACSHIIRVLPPASDMQPSPEELLAARAASLIERVRSFTTNVLRTAD